MEFERIIAVRTLKTVYRDGDRTIKLFSPHYPKEDILHEAFNITMVERASINTPRLLEVTQIDGRWAIVTNYISGTTISQLMKKNPQDGKKLLEMFASIHAKIHSHEPLLLDAQFDPMDRLVMASSLPATLRYDMHFRLQELSAQRRCLCHGDFDPSNCIVTDSGEAYIIDWSAACRGTPGADAALTFLRLGCEYDEESANIYLDSYLENSGLDRDEVKAWIPISATAMSMICPNDDKKYYLEWANS